MYKCLECQRKFKTTKAAEKATNKGCPGCGGTDIDVDANPDQGFECDPQPKYDAVGRPVEDDEITDR